MYQAPNHRRRLGSALRLMLLVALALALPALFECQCNTCSVVLNLACVSQSEFQVCVNGSPLGAVTSCPSGYICSTTTNTGICQPNQDGIVADCSECNTCDANGMFACTGVQTYALCLGSTTPSNMTGFCAQNFVCSIDYPQICGDATLGVFPTCPTDGGGEITTTTIMPSTTYSPVKYPQKYCHNLQQYGRFPVGYNISSTCRQYIFCVVNGGYWSGQLYTCPGRTYFNSSSRLCEDAIPENCS